MVSFYGFLTFDEENLFHWVDPKLRDTSVRDFAWFESMWKRNLISNKGDRYIGKLFSLSSNLPLLKKSFLMQKYCTWFESIKCHTFWSEFSDWSTK